MWYCGWGNCRGCDILKILITWWLCLSGCRDPRWLWWLRCCHDAKGRSTVRKEPSAASSRREEGQEPLTWLFLSALWEANAGSLQLLKALATRWEWPWGRFAVLQASLPLPAPANPDTGALSGLGEVSSDLAASKYLLSACVHGIVLGLGVCSCKNK